MITNKILNPDETYTFSKFFELKIEARQLAFNFGYEFERKWLQLPQWVGELDRIQQTQERILEILPHVNLSSEVGRREILISPILVDVVHYTGSEMQIEYSIKVNKQLQGIIDYFLEAPHNVLIVEAKNSDLTFGMTQLISQLIALDNVLEESKQPVLIGTVTTGRIWEFARLHRQNKSVVQGLENYRVPDDMEVLTRILVEALIGE